MAVPTDANYAVYFAEDIIEYALKYRNISWNPQRTFMREQQYLKLPGDVKFNSNIGHTLLLVHAKYENYIKAESTAIRKDIFSGFSAKETFISYINKSYERPAPNLEVLLCTVAVIVSSCVPCVRNRLHYVICDAVFCIRYAVLKYSKRVAETIKDLQLFASKMRIVDNHLDSYQILN